MVSRIWKWVAWQPIQCMENTGACVYEQQMTKKRGEHFNEYSHATNHQVDDG